MIAALLTSPDVASAAVTLAVAVFGAVQGSEWNQRRKERKRVKAKRAVGEGVYSAYRTITAPYKDTGQKLPQKVKTEARVRALSFARRLGAREGVDIDVVLGADYVEHHLERAVDRLNESQARQREFSRRNGPAGLTQGGS